MINKCKYEGSTPTDLCGNCEILLQTCTFVASKDGYSLGSECDRYLCSSCSEDCIYNDYLYYKNY